MPLRFLILIAIFLGSLVATRVHAAESASIRICGDHDPLSMTADPQSGSGKKPQLIGFSYELIRAVFQTLGKNVTFIDGLPWKRCLSEVENGSIDFAMDAYYDLDREKIFTYSTHYNTLTPQIFFRKERPVDFSNAASLKKYRGCGVVGTSYAHYGIRPAELELGINREALFGKLFARHCDYFLEELEDIVSFKMTGTDYLANPALRHETVNWAVPPSKFLVTLKNGKYAPMMDQINEAIYSFIKSGQAEKIWQRSAVGLPYKP